VEKMNKNNQQVNGDDKVGINQEVSGKRRLLMKGAAGAVPAILTLRSGAAFALNSSETCIAKDNRVAGNTPPAVLAADNSDVWVRSRVECRTLSDGNNLSFQVYLHNNTVWRHELYDNAGNQKTYADASGGMIETGTTVPVYTITAIGFCYVLVIMDATGLPVDEGNAVATASGLPYVTGSCWASAAP
jgi:hypothetical protein